MKREEDNLLLDTRRAEKLGYGVHYGRYKADYPFTRVPCDEARTTEKPEKQKRFCRVCGKEITKSWCYRYCSNDCYAIENRLYYQRKKQRKMEKDGADG